MREEQRDINKRLNTLFGNFQQEAEEIAREESRDNDQ